MVLRNVQSVACQLKPDCLLNKEYLALVKAARRIQVHGYLETGIFWEEDND